MSNEGKETDTQPSFVVTHWIPASSFAHRLRLAIRFILDASEMAVVAACRAVPVTVGLGRACARTLWWTWVTLVGCNVKADAEMNVVMAIAPKMVAVRNIVQENSEVTAMVGPTNQARKQSRSWPAGGHGDGDGQDP